MFKAIIFISTIIFSSSILANQNYKIILGSATPGGFVVLQVGQGSIVEFKEKTINADAKGRVLIGFAREAKTNQQFKLIKENGEITFPTIQIVSRTYNEQRIYGLPKNKVTPDKKTNDKIWQDILKARQARKIVLPNPFFDSGFDWAASGIITGVYGSRRVLNDIPKRAHYGVDIAAPIGTHIYAPADGKITLKENMVLSGLTIMIDHGYGLRSTLIHLNEMLVEKGDLVEKGQLVGKMGMTGRATGSHLHWGMSWHNIRLDPVLIMEHPAVVGDVVSHSFSLE